MVHRMQRDFLPPNEQLPAARRFITSQDLHQRRFAGAVIAKDPKDLSLPQRQRHAVERGNGPESLDDLLRPQRLRITTHRPPSRASRVMWMLNSIAPRIAAPRMMLNRNALMPMSVNPSFNTPSTTAPINAPMTVPEPPVS